jgi:hypothetical protein
MEPSHCHSVFRLLVAIVSTAAMCGCGTIHFQELAVSVCDDATGQQLPGTMVRVQVMCPEMAKVNLDKVHEIQDGITDASGAWSVKIPVGYPGAVSASREGYKVQSVTFRARDPIVAAGKIQVRLTRTAGTSPEARGGSGQTSGDKQDSANTLRKGSQ